MSIRGRLTKLEQRRGPDRCLACRWPLPATTPITPDTLGDRPVRFAPIDLDNPSPTPGPCTTCGRVPPFRAIAFDGDKEAATT